MPISYYCCSACLVRNCVRDYNKNENPPQYCKYKNCKAHWEIIKINLKLPIEEMI